MQQNRKKKNSLQWHFKGSGMFVGSFGLSCDLDLAQTQGFNDKPDIQSKVEKKRHTVRGQGR